jgi:hypothetical protein
MAQTQPVSRLSASGSPTASGRSGNKTGDVGREEFDRHIHDLHGKSNQMRTQITELNKKVGRGLGGGPDPTPELRQLKAESAQLKAESAHMQQDLSQFRQELAQSAQTRQEAARALQEINQVRQQVTEARQQMAQLTDLPEQVRGLKSQLDQLKDLKNMKKELSELKRETEGAKSAIESAKQLQQEVTRLKQELQSSGIKDIKQELKTSTKKQLEHEREIGEVKKKAAGAEFKEELGKVKSDNQVTEREFRATTMEFKALKKQLNDLGVLKPPKVEVAPDEPPPVGTIELGEDCFTARMIMKLGYMKTKQESIEEGRESARTLLVSMDCSSVDSDDGSVCDVLSNVENVHGLGAPSIEEGGRGYCAISQGFGVICVITLFLQIFIVACLLHYATAFQSCLDKQLTVMEWWILHLSKAFAVGVAGCLMMKEFMDIINGWMVSVLLEPNFNLEVAVVNLLRFILSLIILLTNVTLFQGITDPINVWMSMASLAFVGELSVVAIDQGKKGVFGHAIRATLTELNYELTFVSEYPWWIPYVQYSTLFAITILVSYSGVVVFVSAEKIKGVSDGC